MSTDMTDGLVLSAILLTIVGLTQIGRHRAYLIVLILPFLTCTAGAVFALASMRLNLANIVATLLVLGIGTVIGLWLNQHQGDVGGSPTNGRFYTRCR
jgi:predicted exporter